MEANKTYILQLKPIAEIQPEQCNRNTLCTNGEYWINGQVYEVTEGEFECTDGDGTTCFNITHFAVLPK